MTEQEEKKNQRTGMMVSVGLHAALLILFFFLLAWREPNPPLPDYGIELNFGMDAAGSGDEQTQQPPNQTENTEDSKPEESPATEEVTEDQPETETAPVEEIQEIEPEVIEETVPEPEVVATQPTESPVVKKEEPVKKEEEKPEPVTKPEPEKEPVEDPTPPAKVTETESNTDGVEGNEGEQTEAKASNQGDDADKTGDKGDPEGTLDSRALYGTPGGGGGASLNMSGWNWDNIPRPDDTSNEEGRIVFEIQIDDQGEIIGVRTIEKTVSPAVERIYRREVERITFTRTSESILPASTYKGQITFIIKAK